MPVDVGKMRELFRQRFGRDAEVVVRAPGRVNIIGEHTDYNHGFVLPMAIERYTYILASNRADSKVSAYAANFEQAAEADLRQRARDAERPWLDYLVGVADELAKMGKPLRGIDCLIAGDVPVGCGLSSSASLEMAALVMFESLGGYQVDGAEGARLGQRVENLFLGLNTGIMDQFISRMGKEGHALFLDCRSFEFEHIPVAFAGSKFVVANTGVSRGLTASKYNERVEECRRAVTAMNRPGKHGTHLRDFDRGDLEEAKEEMPETSYYRALHVITEDARTQAACEAMRKGDAVRLGDLMNKSDQSLRDYYQVTCRELDAMTAIARALPGCYGARMTGAGFGGCAISLVDADAVDGFCKMLMTRYKEETGLAGEIIISGPAAGAAVVK